MRGCDFIRITEAIEEGCDKSVTEVEFDYAGERGLDRLCFLVNPKYPWPPESIDFENNHKLELFKNKIRSSFIRAEFTTVDDFKAKLMSSLIDWQKRSTDKLSYDPSRALQYGNIKVSNDNQFWIAGNKNPFRGDYVYPTQVFDWQWRYEFDLKIEARPEDADPSLDITILNAYSEPILIIGIGIEVLKIGEIDYSGASMPKALKVPVMDKYIIETPDLMAILYEKRLKEEVLSIDVSSTSWGQLMDPIYIEAKAPYRYELLLKDFGKRVPRFTLLRLITETSSGQVYSDNILFRRWM